MKPPSSLLLGPLLAVLSGCGGHSLPPTPGAPVPAPAPRTLEVGTARADLTLPPGPSTFGHGPDSQAAEGFWTRNYCRVFYFATSSGERLALVPCDLPAMSMLLQRSVAERTKDVIHASELMMTATHTHAGVGHYFGARQYTGIFSSRLPGYDDALAVALATRLGAAVLEAARNKRPARLRWEHRDDFWCYTRNRSLAAYQLNRPAYAPRSTDACTRDRPDLLAIDPSMDVLKIDAYDPAAPQKDLGPLGSISFFAMHPTVVHNTNQLFGADVPGVVSRHVEEHLRRERCQDLGGSADCAGDPLHGVINTNEGDVSPVWSRGTIDEAIEVGRRLGEFVWKAHPPPETPAEANPVIDSRYVEEDITRAKFVEDTQTYKLCGYGQVGQGAARGGSDHPTSFATIPTFGTDAPANFKLDGCHAPKVPLLGPVSLVTRAPGSFPTHLPLAVARISDTMIAFVPAELTVTAGHRLKRRVQSELSSFAGAPERVVVAGLANEYIQYVATAEEYPLQDYEGASTLFGPNSSLYLTNRFGLLARSMFDQEASKYLEVLELETGVARDIEFGFGPSIDTGIFDRTGDYQRQHLGTCRMPEPQSSKEPPRFCVYWRDGGPGDVRLHKAPWISVVGDTHPRRRVRVCQKDAAGVCDPSGLVDDEGYEFITRIHEKVGDGWIWSTLFSPTPETWEQLRARSVRIEIAGNPRIESAAFSADCQPARCTMRQARLCTPNAETSDWEGLILPERNE